ncbi:helix-turn-helix domain-containing protein [Burkholderia pyrrocinia]|uniref:helix-turn-helix transcriptional regulator n=1 Tax=Burkholderia pyrrocinia TaxID=60550 RepID=UPI00215B64C1|nr:helix-turn-helix domain-containing protein [Burkholderia pyrrocinia]UVE64758.1 helix-turn-helix domain-containing protein [Burkholderia pyrrocinia]
MSATRFMTTKEVAERMRITPATVYKRCCDHGDFWGVLPVKGPNGRLLWPVEAIHGLLDRYEVDPKS